MSASVCDKKTLQEQEHKLISKENILNQGLTLNAKGHGWVSVTKILMLMESKGIVTEFLLIARHGNKCFTLIASFNPPNSTE